MEANLGRVSLGQIRFFRDRKVTLPGKARNNERSSDLVAEIEARLTPAWRVAGALQWNSSDDETGKNSIAVRYQPDPDRVLNAAYRFVRGTSEHVDFSFAWPLLRNWKAVGTLELRCA